MSLSTSLCKGMDKTGKNGEESSTPYDPSDSIKEQQSALSCMMNYSNAPQLELLCRKNSRITYIATSGYYDVNN